jgi:Ni,Fe-hydrogenase I cytochrome b subunit
MVVTGFLYMFYRYPQRHGIEALNVEGLRTIAVLHTAGAFLLVAFVMAHVYLTTTGRTATSNLEAMLTGCEELEENERDVGQAASLAQDRARTGDDACAAKRS